jgi:hypothetical protein
MIMWADALPDRPEWRNPAMFSAWIEKNISRTPAQRYSADAPDCTLDSVDDDKK